MPEFIAGNVYIGKEEEEKEEEVGPLEKEIL